MCQFGVIQNMVILDSLRKFIFCFKFLKSDKNNEVSIKVKKENSCFLFYRENYLLAKVGF